MKFWNFFCLRVTGWMGFSPSRRMNQFLQVAASLSDAEEDENNVSFWAADAVIEPRNDLPELQTPRNRFMRRMLTDGMKRSLWEQFAMRARSLNSAHVIDHFAQVTGHSVQDLASCMDDSLDTVTPRWTDSETLESAGKGFSSVSVTKRDSRVSPAARKALGLDRFHEPTETSDSKWTGWLDSKALLRLQSVGSRAVVSSLGLYLVLILVGSWKPALDIDAITRQLPEYSWLELGSRPRGRIIHTDLYVSRRYNKAVRILRKANTSVFGYLPGFRADVLNEGIMELESAIAFQKTTGYLYPQALMLLADAYVRAGQPEKAIPLIDHVIVLNKKKASEARLLRSALREKGLY